MAKQAKKAKTPADVLGKMLMEARREAEVKQEVLAEQLGFSKANTVIARIESGDRDILLLEFIEFCESVDQDPVALFSDFLAQIEGMPRTTVRKMKRAQRGK